MSLKHLKSEATEETKTDVLPGSGFTVETGLYEMIVDVAYMDKSPAGAEAMKIHLKMADGSPQEVREAFWVASRDSKNNQTFYLTKNGKKRDLPGFVQATQVANITCNKPLLDLVEEKKVIKLWNSANQAEENTEIRHLPEIVGKPILVGVLKIRDNKNEKVGNEYVPTAAERFFNEVDKVFHPNGLSITEKAAVETTPAFKDRWLKRYPPGFVADRYTQVAGSQPDLPITDAAPPAPVSSLFSSHFVLHFQNS